MTDFKTQFLRFDSASSQYIYDPNNTSSSNLNPFKAQYQMNQTFRNIKRVYLNSVEMPIGFTNIRTGSNDTFKFILNGTPYTVILPEKIYNSITQIVADLNTLIAIQLSSTQVVMTISFTISQYTPNRLLITFISKTVLTFTLSCSTTTNHLSQGLGITPLVSISQPINSTFLLVDTNLSNSILGFRASRDYFATLHVFAATTANYILNPDNYINMYIPTLNGMNASMSGQLTTFKIPLNSVSNQVYFFSEQTSYRQFVDITDGNLTLSNLTVIIIDKYGNNINPNGLDFSFTLSIELWN